MSAAMCVIFIGAWTPYAIVSFMYTQNKYVPYALVVAAPMCAKSNTFLHPIIYYLAVKRFRDEVKAQLIRLHILKPNETDLIGEMNTMTEKMPCGSIQLCNIGETTEGIPLSIADLPEDQKEYKNMMKDSDENVNAVERETLLKENGAEKNDNQTNGNHLCVYRCSDTASTEAPVADEQL